jgi:hypothetical protein
MKMSEYNQEQLAALEQVVESISKISTGEKQHLLLQMTAYVNFRNEVGRFLQEHFAAHCTHQCYQSNVSACCSREGIITFYADVVINAIHSMESEINELFNALKNPRRTDKCVYLGSDGCLWRIKPIVCEMFLCDAAVRDVFGNRPDLADDWAQYRATAKTFKWPDQPVLFDDLERYFMGRGCDSSLMYLHKSPGLLRVKQLANRRV